MYQFLLLVLAVILPVLGFSAPVNMANQGIRYEMNIEGQKAWQKSYVVINTNAMPYTGEVGIDLSLGPQGRSPKAYEKMNVLPFTAKKIKKGGKSFKFVISIDKAFEYKFKLKKNKKGGWKGKVKIKNLESGKKGKAKIKCLPLR